jgi:hypothetical protein
MTQYIVTFGKGYGTYCIQVYQKGSLCGRSIDLTKKILGLRFSRDNRFWIVYEVLDRRVLG